MKVLITGGAGFVGSHLAERLLKIGHEVVAVDDLSTGSRQNLKHIEKERRFRFVYDSVRNSETMNLLIAQCDAVFHLAAAVGVQLIVDEPVHTIETNIHGTEVVLAIANKFCKKVLIASSSEVYGKGNGAPFSEDDDSLLGSTKLSRWSYACSKAIDEFLGLAYHEQYGLPVVVVRLFNTVGPRQVGRYGMVIPRFVEWALKNEPLLIYGTGKQIRCFGYVGDVVSGLIDLMNCREAFGQIYNIGSEEETTIEHLADRVIQITGSKSRKKYVSYEQAYGKPFDDMVYRVPCLDRIRRATGYDPKTGLDQILQTVVEDAKNRI